MDERTLRGEVLYAVDPDEQADYDLQPELEALAESHRILVVREGGSPSRFERLASFLRREPIAAVTLVTDDAAGEGDVVETEVRETDLVNVYVASDVELS